MTNTSAIHGIANRFLLPGRLTNAIPYSGGHINDSWKLMATDGAKQYQYLLQRINDHVFPRPELVMDNIRLVTEHVSAVLQREGQPDIERRSLTLVPTREGKQYYTDQTDSLWRVFVFIDRSISVQRPSSAQQVYEASRAFGAFQRRLSDYNGPALHETIPFFHDTPKRVATLERAIEADTFNRSGPARAEIQKILSQRGLATALIDRSRSGDLPTRIVHNDAKIANVLFDASTGKGLCVVDLDTVMPGLSLYDFGDLARSMASLTTEDEAGVTGTCLSLELFESAARGYLAEMQGLLTEAERKLLVTAARLITYEQAVRFLTDFLEGDHYYKTYRPDQNLDRCRIQLALLDDLTQSEPELTRLVDRI